MRIYLDSCCYGRPFDDKSIDRNRLEAEVILILLDWVRAGRHQLVSSEVVTAELSRNPNEVKRIDALMLAKVASSTQFLEPADFHRQANLIQSGFDGFDALHVAAAEAAHCQSLLTTDDRFIRIANTPKMILDVKVQNPLEWFGEQTWK